MSATLDSLRRAAKRSCTHPQATDGHCEHIDCDNFYNLAEVTDRNRSIGTRLTAQQDRGIAQMLSNETVPMMNDAQKAYVLSLLQRMSQARPEIYALAKVWYDHNATTITKRQASEVIDRLKAQLAAVPAPMPATSKREWDSYDDIPTGYYAVSNDDGHTSFYHVQHRDNGRVYIDLQVSDSLTRISWATCQAAFAKIRNDGPQACAERYARELGKCYRCGRTLTDETSRALGIGPTCRSKGMF